MVFEATSVVNGIPGFGIALVCGLPGAHRSTMEAHSYPRFVPVKAGWAAVGDGWAVIAASRSEALERYREAESKHEELRIRDLGKEEPMEEEATPTSR
jgi:hypothetical protein